jgi:hypothetical protein
MVTGNATHQAALLAAMANPFNGPATIDELAARLPIGRKQIATAAAKLIQRSYVERLETGVYALTLTGRKALEDGASLNSGPHRGKRKHPLYRDSLQQRAWTAMRLSQRFTIGDIVTLAAKEGDKHPEQSLQRYFYRLTRAGYLVELPTRVMMGSSATSNGFKQWRLLRDTGEHSPRWLDRRQAFKDWNTREVFPCV